MQSEQQHRPLVAVSTFALYDVVRHLADNSVDLFMVVPFGVDVHSFEPTPRELAKLTSSSLFVYSGAGLEPWAEAFSKTTTALDISNYVNLIHLEKADDEHSGHHHNERTDPHYWLDMNNMVLATKVIEKMLVKIIPDNADQVHHNAQRYIQRLNALDERYRKQLSNCQKPYLIVNHNAFGYLAHRYGFAVVALTGLSPESMPSAKTMATLTDKIKSDQIGTIFFESFVSDRLINNIARESGTRVDVLQPLANITADEVGQGSDFESLMIKNLLKLSRAMECE